MTLVGDEARPVLKGVPLTALAHERLVDETLGDDDVGHRGQHGDVGAGLERQVIGRVDMRRMHEVGTARIDDDDLGALAKTALHAAAEHGMRVGGVGADEQHHVRVHHAVEILRAGRGAEGLREAVARRRVADPRAGIHIVGAEARAHQLLDQIGLFVGAA